MYCPLILCREETTSGSKGLDIMPRFKNKKRWHDKRRRKEYDIRRQDAYE
jgi:hypothetical protein